jgi:hypothetical protein
MIDAYASGKCWNNKTKEDVLNGSKAVINPLANLSNVRLYVYSKGNITPDGRFFIRRYLTNNLKIDKSALKRVKLPIIRPGVKKLIDDSGIIYEAKYNPFIAILS